MPLPGLEVSRWCVIRVELADVGRDHRPDRGVRDIKRIGGAATTDADDDDDPCKDAVHKTSLGYGGMNRASTDAAYR